MATRRTKIPPAVKRQLIEEAGGKCANPGCPSWRTHIHHIKHWSVYRLHNENDMIAVCPTCHDAIPSNGGIDDEVLYRWKHIVRVETDVRNHMYVEPSKDIRVLAGSVCVIPTDGEGAVFQLSKTNHFTFRLVEDDIFLANCLIKDLTGALLVRIIDNYVLAKSEKLLEVSRRPGRSTVRTSKPENYLPSWVPKIMSGARPDLVRSGRSTVLEIEAVGPGVVRFQGIFVAPDGVLAITQSKIYIPRPELNGPLAIVGTGEDTRIISGPITRAAFNM